MAMKKFTRLMLILTAVFLLAGVVHAANYWVAFNGMGGTFTYLMQVDATGKILRGPVRIFLWDDRFVCTGCPSEPTNPLGHDGLAEDSIKGSFVGPRAVAMAFDANGNIHMWQLSVQGTIFHQLINTTTLAPTSGPNQMAGKSFVHARGFESRYFNWKSLSASNTKLAVIAGEIGSDSGAGSFDSVRNAFFSTFTYNADGSFTSVKPKRTGKNITFAKFGAISPDGGMFIVNKELTDLDDWAPLSLDDDQEGAVIVSPVGGTPVTIGNSGTQTGGVDISNPVGANRIAVFTIQSSDLVDTSNGDGVIVQLVNATTGAKVGNAINVTGNVEMQYRFGNVGVAPDGSFVVYSKRPVLSLPPGQTDTLQANNRPSVFFQKLNPATGQAVGSPIQIFSADLGPKLNGAYNGTSDETTGNEYANPGIIGIDVVAN